jgi:hypothetical protein
LLDPLLTRIVDPIWVWTAQVEKMMSNNSKVLRNTLISLAFGAAIPAAWAADPVTPPSPPKFSVTAADSTQPPRLLKVLDLKSPDIHDVMSADQIAAAIPNPDDMDDLDPETVAVHGATPAPYVPGGFAAIYWAVTHPIQSWRVLAPVQ